MKKEKILIQGVGSIGGFVAGRLIRDGYDVALVTGNPSISEAIKRKGITVRSDSDDFTVAANAVTDVADLSDIESFDFIFLAMMAQHAVAGIEKSISCLSPSGAVVTFQNGIVIDAIAEVCGVERIIPATLAFGATMEAHGEYRLTTGGSFIAGEIDGSESDRLHRLSVVLEKVLPTKTSSNIMGVLWGKLLWNASVSALCAMSGRSLGDICGDPATQGLVIRAYREGVDTATGLSIRLEKVVVDYQTMYVPANASADQERNARELLSSLKLRYAKVTPSTSQSLQKGKPTEIDYLNGYVMHKSQEIHQPAQLHVQLVKIIKEIESNERAIGQQNIDELLSNYDV